jgi:hypothetical protein
MIDNKHSTDEGHDHATDDRSPHAHRRWTDVLLHRWPTALGVAVAALTAFDLRIGVEEVSFLSALVVLMPLVYLGAAVLDRRSFAWVVLLVAVTPLVLTKVLDLKINLHPAFRLPRSPSWRWGRPVDDCAGQVASRSKPPGCSCSARACWWHSTWSRSSVGCSWPSPSSATPPGTPSTTCGTGWSRVRTRSSVPSWSSWLARPSSSSSS